MAHTQKVTQKFQAVPYKTTDIPFISRIFWQLGGADVDLLPFCPSHERTKFSVLGLIVLLLAIGVSILTGFLVNFVISRTIDSTILAPVSSVFAGVLTLVLVTTVLATGLRITSPILHNRTHNKKSSHGLHVLNLYRNMLFFLMPAAIVALWTTYVLVEIKQIFSTVILDPSAYYLPFVSSFAIFLIPFVIGTMWPSPAYAVSLRNSKIRQQDSLLISTEPDSDSEPEPPGATDSDKEEIVQQIDTLDRLHKENPGNFEISSALINLLQKDEQYARVIELYDQLIANDSENSDLIKRQSHLFLKTGDTRRFVSSQARLERIQSQVSFEENLNRTIILDSLKMEGLNFFGNFTWKFQPHVNILLGKNGYGKSYLLRALVGMLQNEEYFTEDYFDKVKSGAFIDVMVMIDGESKQARRDAQAFRDYFGRVPILAIPDMRYINKSQSTVSARSEAVTDLRTQSSWHFLRDKPYEDLIENFLYGLCIDYVEAGRSFDAPLFSLIESAVQKLSDGSFKFHNVRRTDSARFEIYAVTDGNEKTPLRLQQASQGTLSVVAMVGLIYKYLQAISKDVSEDVSKQQHGIVIIDEIDAHLHPTWQSKILDLFRKIFPNVQFLITAHSPLVIRGSKENEVSVLNKESGKFVVDTLPDHFIGATYDQMYGPVFDVEGEDKTFLRLDMLHDRKGEIEKQINELENRKDKNEEDEQNLSQLLDQVYYLRQFEEVRDRRKSDEMQNDISHQQKLENLQLRGKIDNLEAELDRYQGDSPDRPPGDDAIDFLTSLLAKNPENKPALEAIAHYLAKNHRYWQASAAYEALVSVDPENTDYLKDLANQYQGLEQYDKAASVVQQAIELNPDNSELNVVLKNLRDLTGE